MPGYANIGYFIHSAAEVYLFDAVSSAGIRGFRHYMKKMKRQDAEMFFAVDQAKNFAEKISPTSKVLEDGRFFSLVEVKSGMRPSTRFKMPASDLFKMIKMIHLKFE